VWAEKSAMLKEEAQLAISTPPQAVFPEVAQDAAVS
jgi:hypothetical protein